MKTAKLLFIITSCLFFNNSFSQSPDWEVIMSSKDIQKVYTYKNSVTYVLYRGGGLNLFNHYTQEHEEITIYNSPLPSNKINDIAITDDSVVYLASDGGGLIKLENGNYEQIAIGSTWTSENLSHVSIAPNGDIWVSTSGFEVYQITATSIIEHTATEGSIGSFKKMVYLSNGDIYAVGTWGISHYDGNTWKTAKPTFPSSYNDIVIDHNDDLWVTSTKGLLKLQNGSWVIIPNPNGNSTSLKSLFVDDNGKVVYQDFNKWKSFNPANNTWEDYVLEIETDAYTRLLLNNNNDFWLTTETGYVLETKNTNFAFQVPQSLPFGGEVTCFLEDRNENFWIGTLTNGLYKITKTDTILYNYNHGFTDSQVYCLAEDHDGKVWIGGPNRLHYYDNDSIYEVKTPNLSNFYQVEGIFIDEDNSQWLTSSLGLVHFTPTDTTIYNETNSPITKNSYPKQIVGDSKGNLWVITYDGLIRFDKKDDWFIYTPENSGLPTKSINELTLDGFGNLWIGNMNFGNNSLAVWDGTIFKSFDIDPGEFDQVHIESLAIDKYGNKWFSSQSHGLGRFDGNETTYLTHKNSGIPKGNLYKTYIKKDGTIILSGYDMLISYTDPANYLDTLNVKLLIFNDENENNSFDNDEKPIPFAKVKIWGSNKIIYADGEGKINTYLKPEDYLLSSDESSKWTVVKTVAPLTVSAENRTIQNIAFKRVNSIVEASISINNGFPRCNTEVSHLTEIRNGGTTTQDAVLKLYSTSHIISSFPTAEITFTDTLRWSFTDLAPGEIRQVKSLIQLPGFDGTHTVKGQVDFFDKNGIKSTTKEDTLTPEIRCAYDPNDKTPIPSGLGDEKFLLIANSIDYLIRFQNTGNDTAFNVTITDTLSDFLDFNTFKFISSSHPVVTSQEDSLVTFFFKSILLPDSTTDSEGSNGYVRFTIKPKSDVAENSILTNKANIYFDFNPPIITNETQNTLVTKYPEIITSLITDNKNSELALYPNPVADYLSVQLAKSNKGHFTIYNSKGILIKEGAFSSKDFSLNTSDLDAGIYILKLESAETSYTQKFIK